MQKNFTVFFGELLFYTYDAFKLSYIFKWCIVYRGIRVFELFSLDKVRHNDDHNDTCPELFSKLFFARIALVVHCCSALFSRL